MRKYLETSSDKSILSNSMCDLAKIILKNNYFGNGQSKYHQKRGFAIRTKFSPPLVYERVRKENFSKQLV